MNVRVSSASLGGLQGLRWNSFQVTTSNAKYNPITAPSFTVDKITTVNNAASTNTDTLGANTAIQSVILTVASSGICPAWCIPGAAVSVNVTKGGIPYKFATTIREVSADGTKITFAWGPALAQNCSLTSIFTAAVTPVLIGP